MVMIEVEATRQFTQPIRQIVVMLAISALIGVGGYLAQDLLISIYEANIYLNGFIIGVFGIGVLACFMQVFALISSISWLKRFTNADGSFAGNPPRLLSSLVSLMRIRQSKMKIGTAASHSIMESVASRIDEAREITRYINNLLIFLGLLGTFYGLATTVPAVVETIRSLNPSENEGSVEVFGRLMTGLENQLGGMGTAFASSLLGLAGSLVVGVLELFASHGQNRFYRQLEDWLSSITRVNLASVDSDGGPQSSNGILDEVLDQMGDQISDALNKVASALQTLETSLSKADEARLNSDQKMDDLITTLRIIADNSDDSSGEQTSLSKADEARLNSDQKMDDLITTLRIIADNSDDNDGEQTSQYAKSLDALTTLVSGQEKLLERLLMESDNSEVRMNLRNIDANLLRALEELPLNYRETIGDLREDLGRILEAIKISDQSQDVKDTLIRSRKD
ncbi:biopolymer transporter ExbB [Rhodobacteraceae bacterium]|nr:biopolymer transporter ExbB [Paracoccaceae bacterium]MDC1255180.1 biopolymer transporter ExbB [Paracoccaceae bacterium]